MCVSDSSTRVSFLLRFVWEGTAAECARFDSTAESELRSVVAAVFLEGGGTTQALSVQCGSIIVNAVITVEVSLYVDMTTGTFNPSTGLREAVNGKTTLNSFGTLSSTATSTGSCTLSNTLFAGQDTHGSCNAVQCVEGYSIVTSHNRARCVVDGSTLAPRNSDSEWRTVHTIVTALGALSLCLLLICLVHACVPCLGGMPADVEEGKSLTTASVHTNAPDAVEEGNERDGELPQEAARGSARRNNEPVDGGDTEEEEEEEEEEMARTQVAI